MNKMRDLLSKTLVVGVIFLFVGVSIQPAIAVTKDGDNNPPEVPDIDGEKVVLGVEFNFYFTSIDPDGDNVKYFIDWGDGTVDITGFYKSGVTIKVGHTYSVYGKIAIRAYAEDIYGAVGPKGYYIVEWKSRASVVQPEKEIIDVEPKDYLFQTIIDIANNPDVKELLEQYDNNLFKVDIDRSVSRKIFFKNPRMFRSLIFTKPSLTYEYLDKTYNNGIKITSIIGEDKALELIESIEISDTVVFDEFDNIIFKDEELSNRLTTLKKINEEQNSDWNYPIICSIIYFLLIPFEILYYLINIFGDFYFISLFLAFNIAIRIPYWTVLLINAYAYGCV